MGNKYYTSNDVDLHYYDYEVSLWFEKCSFSRIESWKENGLTLGVL